MIPRRYTSVLSFIIPIVFSSFLFQSTESRLLTATDQAIGRWEIRFHRRHRTLFDSLLFPSLSRHSSSSSERRKETEKIPKCILRLDQNGRFTISNPAAVALPTNNVSSPVLSSSETRSSSEGEDSKIEKLLQTKSIKKGNDNDDMTSAVPRPKPILCGKWNLRPNPYCITDRYFDELSLVSYPKTRVISFEKKNKKQRDVTQESTEEDGTTMTNKNRFWNEHAIMELHCKVYGRYGVQRVREILGYGQGRARSRLTHGTVLLVRKGEGVPKLQKRLVVGSFRAVALVDSDGTADDNTKKKKKLSR